MREFASGAIENRTATHRTGSQIARGSAPAGLSRTDGRSASRLMIFDALHLDGFAVRALPYQRRRQRLDGPRARRASVESTPRTFRRWRGPDTRRRRSAAGTPSSSAYTPVPMQLAFRRLINVLDDDSPSAGVFAYCAVFGSACALAVVASVLGVPLGTAMTVLMLVIGAVLLFLAACAYAAACREDEARNRAATEPRAASRPSDRAAPPGPPPARTAGRDARARVRAQARF